MQHSRSSLRSELLKFNGVVGRPVMIHISVGMKAYKQRSRTINLAKPWKDVEKDDASLGGCINRVLRMAADLLEQL